MMQDAYAASRLENDIYSFINVGVLLRKKVLDGKIVRSVDQLCFFDRENDQNKFVLAVEDGKLVSKDLTENIQKKFEWMGIKDPFSERRNAL